MVKKYPQWIDEHARAVHNGFSHMVPGSWGPLDVFAVIEMLNGVFLAKLYQTVVKLKKRHVSFQELAQCFPVPSGFRAAIYFALFEYQHTNPKNKEEFLETVDLFIGILRHIMKRDPFAYESNIVHTEEEVTNMLDIVDWREGNPALARELGKLYTSLSALIHALYRDFFPQDSNDIYGPYDASAKFGKGTILTIKHFPKKMRPVELWPEITSLKYSEVKIFQVYRNVKFRCEWVGMHSLYDGSVIENLIAYSLIVDGKICNDVESVKDLTNYFANIASKQSLIYDAMSHEDLKRKVLEWLCWQFVDFFKLAGMDWRPTEAMLDAVKDKRVGERLEMNTFPSFEEYVTSPDYEIYWLKKLYE